jgi:hypothetical protein
MDFKFFRDKNNQKYIFSRNNICCQVCDVVCQNHITMKQFFYKGHVKRYIVCSPACAKKCQWIGDPELGSYIVIDSISADLSLIAPERAEFQFSNKLSNIDATYHLDCPTIDKTKLAGRETFDGTQIGLSPREAIGFKDDSINISQINNFFQDLKNSTVTISEINKNKLEDKSSGVDE